MQQRVETVAELKKIRFDKKDTVVCKETAREYLFEENGSALTPDDNDIIQAAHGVNARYVAMAAKSSSSGGDPYANQAEAEAGTRTDRAMNPLRVAQALLAQLIAGTNMTKTAVPGGVQLDASATGSMEYVFWPSSPTQTGVLFNDWEDMCAAILALPDGVSPFITFRENFTIPSVNMPVGGWDMRGAAWESPLIATGNVTVTIPDGVIIDNLVSVETGLAVECNPTTADGVFTHSAFGGLQILVIDFGANLYNLGSKALIDQAGQVVIALNGASTLGAGPANVGPWVKANTTDAVLAIMVVASGSTGFPDGWIVGGVAGGVLMYQHGMTFTDPVITWGGDAPIYLNSSKAENLPYDNGASGLTATQVQAAIDELAGMSGGGGASALTHLAFDPDIATSTATNKKTMPEIQTALNALAGYAVLVIKKAGFGQVADVTDAAAYNFSKVQEIQVATDSPGVVLSFGEGSTIDFSQAVKLNGVTLRYTGTSQPLITVATALVFVLEYAMLATGTGAGAELVRVPSGRQLYVHLQGETSGIYRGDFEVIDSRGATVVHVWQKALGGFFASSNIFRNDPSGTGTVNIFSRVLEAAYTATHENYTDGVEPIPVSVTQIAETRVNELITARNLSATRNAPSRALNTIYTNGNKPLILNVVVSVPQNGTTYSVANLQSGSDIVCTARPSVTGAETQPMIASMFAIIAPGANYRVTDTGATGGPPSILAWYEQELGL